MSAGLPGLGLGGLLFIFSALLAPFRQLWRALKGRSRPGDWPMVGRQFAQAVLMVAAIDLTLRLAYVGLSAAGLGDLPAANAGTVLPLTLIGITTALLAATLVAAKLAELALRLRKANLRRRVPARLPRPAPLRALALTGAASELSPLMEPRGNGPADNRLQASLSRPVQQAGPASGVTAVAPTADLAVAAAGQHAAVLSPKSSDQEESSEGSDAGRRTPAPTPQQPSIAPSTPRRQSPSPASPPAGPAPAPEPVAPGGAPESEGASSPESTGPPATAGPPEGSPASDHAGPPLHAGRG
jgi:hypothetical protein